MEKGIEDAVKIRIPDRVSRIRAMRILVPNGGYHRELNNIYRISETQVNLLDKADIEYQRAE